MHVTSIMGARPELIKVAAVSDWFADTEHTHHTVHTGQPYDQRMSQQFVDELHILDPTSTWASDLGPHGAQTGRMLAAVEEHLIGSRPDWLAVYGDTNSTLAGALASVKLHIPVSHLEAGLRSFNRLMPERDNRLLVDTTQPTCSSPRPGRRWRRPPAPRTSRRLRAVSCGLSSVEIPGRPARGLAGCRPTTPGRRVQR